MDERAVFCYVWDAKESGNSGLQEGPVEAGKEEY